MRNFKVPHFLLAWRRGSVDARGLDHSVPVLFRGRKMLSRSLLRLLPLLLCLVISNTAQAQESRGTVTGTVVDQSKAVVPGATVVITNVAMGTDVTAVTNETGFFQAAYLI